MSEDDWKPGETRRAEPEQKRGLFLDFMAAVAVGYGIGQHVGAALAGDPPPKPKAPPLLEHAAVCPTTGVAVGECMCVVHLQGRP